MRDETFETLEENFNLDIIKETMWILSSLEWRKYADRVGNILQPVSNGYLDYFVDEVEQKIDNYTKGWLDAIANLPGIDKMWLWEDYEFGFQQCGGIKFGKKMCGQWLPIPFNMAFLSPGNIQHHGL